jgi:hypothetical protein
MSHAGSALVCGAISLLGFPAHAEQLSDEAALAKLRGEIVQLIAEGSCANLVHCRAVALGWLPCGGPSEYLAYSTIQGKREMIEAKAAEYNFLYEDVQRAKGQAGVCKQLPQPRPNCIDNRCRLDSQGR